MRLRDGKYECSLCGTVLAMPPGEGLRVVIVAASGKPNMRVLTLDHQEIHRCTVGAAPEPPR